MSLCRAVLMCLLLSTAATLPALAETGGPPDSRRWSALADTLFSHLTPNELRYANGLAQDGQGFVWVGTEGGLARWDGYRSRVYVADPRDDGALPSNRVLSLHTDSSGRLWVGTAAGGLARYDPRRDRFLVYHAGPGGLADPSVWAIADDGEHGLWLGTGAGLDHIDMATGAIRSVALPGDSHGAVKAVLQDRGGALWVGTQQGLYRGAGPDQPFAAVALPVSGRAPVAVLKLLKDSGGRVWIATGSHGAFVVEPGQSVPQAIVEPGTEFLQGAMVTSMVEAIPGQIWLGTLGGGIVVVEPAAQWRTGRIRHHVAIATSLQDDDVSAMLLDRSGLVWVSSTMAMNIHDPRQLGVLTLFGAGTRDKPVTSVQVPAIEADPDGRVWLSNGDGGGIELLDPVRGRVAELRPDASRPTSALPVGRVLAMTRGADGALYLGTKKGLYRADAQARRVVRLDVRGRPPDASVFALCVDAGTLWMGGADGLWALDIRRGGQPEVLLHRPADAVGSDRVTSLLRAPGDILWVGTSTGLDRLDLASGRLQRLAADAKDPTALLAGYVASLLLDARGRLWIAEIGSGVQVVERQGGDGRLHVRRLGVRQGLPHDSVNKLLLDATGSVWASTDNGLIEIDSSTFAVRTLGAAEGVDILQYWSDSGAKTTAGDLLFGGMGGITVVRPELTRQLAAPPPVVATEARAGGVMLLASSLNGSLSMPGKRLEVPAQDHSLMVEFAALDFTAPALNRYSYRLRGFDTEWTETDASRRVASYTNLPPGDYTLQLRGSGYQAPWTASTLEIAVRVLPRWYQTAFFRLAVVFAAIVVFAATLHLRTAYLRGRERELEALVALRTAELMRRGEELRISQQELQKIAYSDPLTGLANRRLFNEDLRHVIALVQRGLGHVTMLLIDLDRFKQVNDTMGHDAGDALLVEVARRLVATVRLGDRVARLGGDEFAVLLAASDERGDAEAACRRIVRDLAAPFDRAGRRIEVTASVGAARCPEHASDAEALYKCADLALYHAKTAGRNQWRWFEASPALSSESAACP